MSRNYGKIKKPQRDRLLDLMWDRKWHDSPQMIRACGERPAARLRELKRQGFRFDSKPKKRGTGKMYRLLSRKKSAPDPKRVKVYLFETDAAQAAVGTVTKTARKAIADALGSFRYNKHKL